MSQGRSSIDRSGGLDTNDFVSTNPGRQLRELIRSGHSFSGRERNCCFLNLGVDAQGRHRAFANVSAASGVDLPDDARAIALTDWNLDGAIDWWCLNRSGPQLRLYLNRSNQAQNHYLKVLLESVSGSRDAIGARVTLEIDSDEAGAPVRLQRTLRAGDGYLAQSSKWLHFGLGDQRLVEKLTVRWPSGKESVFQQLAADQHFLVHEMHGLTKWQPPTNALEVTGNVAADPAPAAEDTVDRGTLISSPLRLPSTIAKFATDADRGQRYLLVSLWASWCQPCVQELAMLEAESTRLTQHGISVLALNVEVELDEAQRKAAFARLAVSFEGRLATKKTLDELQFLHDQTVDLHLPLPLPCNFLVDRLDSRLLAFYKGPVDVEQVTHDVQVPSGDLARRRSEGTRFDGLWDGKPKRTRTLVAILDLLQRGNFEEAYAWTRDAGEQLRQDPDLHVLLFNLGQELTRRNQHQSAVRLYLAALKSDPALEPALYNLGISYALLGKHEEANPVLERAYLLRPAARTAYVLAKSKARTGDLPRARDLLQAAVAKSPEGDIVYEYALVLALGGDVIKAEAAYRRSVAIDAANRSPKALKKFMQALTWNQDEAAEAAAGRVQAWIHDRQ